MEKLLGLLQPLQKNEALRFCTMAVMTQLAFQYRGSPISIPNVCYIKHESEALYISKAVRYIFKYASNKFFIYLYSSLTIKHVYLRSALYIQTAAVPRLDQYYHTDQVWANN